MIFNPLDKFYKSQIGAVDCSKGLTFRVKGNFDSVLLRVKKDGSQDYEFYKMTKETDFFSLQLKLERGLYFYCFDIGNGLFVGKNKDFDGVITNNPTEYQLTFYDKGYKTPDWFKGGIIYQIFPDRFSRHQKDKTIDSGKILRDDWGGTPSYLPNEQGEVLNNDFFGGDIQGIIDKLDYIASLGVSVIYLNPIFKAYSNHRYDTGDYMQIDPILGTENDFIDLITKAKEKDIKIVLDGVFNHTGSDSLYFNKNASYDSVGAFQSKNSQYYNWYNFINYPNEYQSWWGIKTLPSTSKQKGNFTNFITGKDGVLEKYTKLGIGGWRLDVVDELPTEFVRDIRSSVKNVNKDAIIIGEVWEDASNKISYGVRREYFQGKELDSVMNYPLKNAILDFVLTGDSNNLCNVINEQIDHYPKFVLDSLMNILSTHDTFRLLSSVSGIDVEGKSKAQMENILIENKLLVDAKFRLKCATLLQYFLYGVPSVYYGDEIGMQGFVDPLNRRCFTWDTIDDEILQWYIKLGKIRKNYSVFADGEYSTIYKNHGILLFARKDVNCEILICINVSDKEYNLSFDGNLRDLIEDKIYSNSLALRPKSFGVFVND